MEDLDKKIEQAKADITKFRTRPVEDKEDIAEWYEKSAPKNDTRNPRELPIDWRKLRAGANGAYIAEP
jgi:hypothetical protein